MGGLFPTARARVDFYLECMRWLAVCLSVRVCVNSSERGLLWVTRAGRKQHDSNATLKASGSHFPPTRDLR
jgi:hypothetical protein